MFLKISDKKKRYLLLAGSFLALVLILVAVVMAVGYMLHRSFGWFSSNTVVNNTGMSVRTSAELIELAVVNDDENDNGIYEPDEPLQIPGDGISFVESAENIVYYLNAVNDYALINETTSAQPKLYCRFRNEKPNTDDEVIKPGDFGTISFDIIKKVEGDLKLNIDFTTYGVKHVLNGTVVDGVTHNYVSLDPTVDEEVMRYLRGHIVFFGNREPIMTGGVATGEYYYSDLLTDNRISLDTSTVTPEDVDGVDHYRVTIYWIWPSTYAQIAYEEGDPKLHTHALFGSDAAGAAQRAAFLAHISGTYNQQDPTDYTNDYFKSTVVRYDNTAGMEHDSYVDLSNGYNNADQMIGDRVNYLVVEADVSLDTTPAATPEP